MTSPMSEVSNALESVGQESLVEWDLAEDNNCESLWVAQLGTRRRALCTPYKVVAAAAMPRRVVLSGPGRLGLTVPAQTVPGPGTEHWDTVLKGGLRKLTPESPGPQSRGEGGDKV